MSERKNVSAIEVGHGMGKGGKTLLLHSPVETVQIPRSVCARERGPDVVGTGGRGMRRPRREMFSIPSALQEHIRDSLTRIAFTGAGWKLKNLCRIERVREPDRFIVHRDNRNGRRYLVSRNLVSRYLVRKRSNDRSCCGSDGLLRARGQVRNNARQESGRSDL
jgi:hypothetical protein